MSSAPNANTDPLPKDPSLVAGVLSYVIPGLGQIYQGRFGKGFLFMVSLLGMFILGQAMGNWQNVYVSTDSNRRAGGEKPRVVNLLTRWHYGGQFWIGAAAWPALWQHFKTPDPVPQPPNFWRDFQKEPEETEVNKFLIASDKTPDLGWVYTVIAGMLNILVIYDAYAGPAFLPLARPTTKPTGTPQVAASKEGAV